MIDITIYTGRLEAKLLAANRRITNAIEQGVSRGSDEITKEIDDFMFVPLAFTSDVEQRGEDTTAKIGVNLDLKQRSDSLCVEPISSVHDCLAKDNNQSEFAPGQTTYGHW